MSMELLIVILIVVALVVIAGAGFVVSRGRSGRAAPPTAPTPDLDEAESAEAPPTPFDTTVDDQESPTAVVEPPVVEPAEPVEEAPAAPATFRDRLGKARSTLGGYFGSVLGREVDPRTWDELEEALVLADVGIGTATAVIEEARAEAKADNITDPAAAIELVRARLKAAAGGHDTSLDQSAAPSVWLFVGVNGVGKTTTIGKVGTHQVREGRSVVMAAGDTFRAAAGEQLEMWADRAGAAIVRGAEGADPSSVIFDGIASAGARGAELVLADTAGRLHTKSNLMEELRKVRRVADRGALEQGGAVTEVLLVIDATTGQNGLNQARLFTEAVEVTGVVLTKLDGSAKGGIVMAIQTELGIPVKLVGLGEGADDLVPFDPDQFVDALFDES